MEPPHIVNAGNQFACLLFAALIGSTSAARGQFAPDIPPVDPGELTPGLTVRENDLVRVQPADIGPKRYRHTRAVDRTNGARGHEKKSKTSGTLEIIFDSSNSMNGRIAGVRKIDLAKEALKHLANALEGTDFRVGLRVFGNDKSIPIDDMARASMDSHLVLPIAKNNMRRIRDYIPRLGAHGRTPIAYSIQQGGKDLRAHREHDPIILLISDGIESCNGDPIAAVTSLKTQGIRVKTHVIGFDLKDAEKESLRALAQAGDGRYYDAADLTGLLKSLDAFVETVEVKAPPHGNYANPATGGKDQASACELKAGKYTLWKHLDKGQRAWFKVHQGLTKRVAIKTYINGHGVHRDKDGTFKYSEHLKASSSIHLYDKGGKKRSSVVLHGDEQEWARLHMLDSRGEGVFFAIGSDFGCTPRNLMFEVIVQEAGDLWEGIEAPDDIKAGNIPEAPLHETFYGHMGSPDRADVYKVAIPEEQKGKKLQLDIKFSDVDKPCRFKIEFYDARTGKRLSRHTPLSSGTTLELDPSGARQLLFKVSDNNPALYYLMNSYRVKLAIK